MGDWAPCGYLNLWIIESEGQAIRGPPDTTKTTFWSCLEVFWSRGPSCTSETPLSLLRTLPVQQKSEVCLRRLQQSFRDVRRSHVAFLHLRRPCSWHDRKIPLVPSRRYIEASWPWFGQSVCIKPVDKEGQPVCRKIFLKELFAGGIKKKIPIEACLHLRIAASQVVLNKGCFTDLSQCIV